MLQEIKISDSNWDNIVKSFIKYDVYYLKGYVKAFNLQGEGEPLLLYYNDGETRGINVVVKRDIATAEPFINKIPTNTFFDLTSPYGYGGFLIEGKKHSEINTSFERYCYQENIITDFVRFHLINGYQSKYNGVVESKTRNVVRDLNIPLEQMFMDFEHKVRKSIKKAHRAELEVEIDSTGKRLEEFLAIYYGTMDRSNAKETFYYPKEFFETLNEMNDNYVYFHVWHEEKIISTELVLFGSENCYSFLGGTDRNFFHLSANSFLKYEVIKWAKEKGLKRFILGGGYGADDGIFKYKKSFAPGGVYDFYVGKKIFNKEKYTELIEIRKDEQDFDKDTFFFPAYREN